MDPKCNTLNARVITARHVPRLSGVHVVTYMYIRLRDVTRRLCLRLGYRTRHECHIGTTRLTYDLSEFLLFLSVKLLIMFAAEIEISII